MRRTCLSAVLAGVLLGPTFVGCAGEGSPGELTFPVSGRGGRAVMVTMTEPTISQEPARILYSYSVRSADQDRWTVDIAQDRLTHEGEAKLAQGERTIVMRLKKTQFGRQVDFIDSDGQERTSTVVVLPDGDLATPPPAFDYRPPANAAAQPFGEPFVFGMASLGFVADTSLRPFQLALLQAITEYGVPVEHDQTSLSTSADTPAAEDCKDEVWPARVKAPILPSTATLKPPIDGAPTFTMGAWGIWNSVRSKCPKGKSPEGDAFGSIMGRFSFDTTQAELCKGGVVLTIKGAAFSMIDNKLQSGGPGCTLDGEVDSAEAVSVEAKAGDVASLTWAAAKVSGDLGCNTPQCAAFTGEGWLCVTLSKTNNEWLMLPNWTTGSKVTARASTKRTSCTTMESWVK